MEKPITGESLFWCDQLIPFLASCFLQMFNLFLSKEAKFKK